MTVCFPLFSSTPFLRAAQLVARRAGVWRLALKRAQRYQALLPNIIGVRMKIANPREGTTEGPPGSTSLESKHEDTSLQGEEMKETKHAEATKETFTRPAYPWVPTRLEYAQLYEAETTRTQQQWAVEWERSRQTSMLRFPFPPLPELDVGTRGPPPSVSGSFADLGIPAAASDDTPAKADLQARLRSLQFMGKKPFADTGDMERKAALQRFRKALQPRTMDTAMRASLSLWWSHQYYLVRLMETGPSTAALEVWFKS